MKSFQDFFLIKEANNQQNFQSQITILLKKNNIRKFVFFIIKDCFHLIDSNTLKLAQDLIKSVNKPNKLPEIPDHFSNCVLKATYYGIKAIKENSIELAAEAANFAVNAFIETKEKKKEYIKKVK